MARTEHPPTWSNLPNFRCGKVWQGTKQTLHPCNCNVICCPLQLNLSFEEKPNSVGPFSRPNLNNSCITYVFVTACIFEGVVVMGYKNKNRRKRRISLKPWIIDRSWTCVTLVTKDPAPPCPHKLFACRMFWTSNPGKTYLSKCVTSFWLCRTRFWFLKPGNSTDEVVKVVFNSIQ